MRIYDVTVTLRTDMPIYPGDPSFEHKFVSSLVGGQGANVSVLTMGAHTGTHIDAPYHMVQSGATVDRIDPSILVGPAVVIDATGRDAVNVEDLAGWEWSAIERVLFKTDNSGKLEQLDQFIEDYVPLAGESAQFLVENGVKLVGIDYLSVDRFHSGTHPAHMPLLEAGVVIIEGLDLSEVSGGLYEVFCGPLKIMGADGTPARVMLVDRSDEA